MNVPSECTRKSLREVIKDIRVVNYSVCATLHSTRIHCECLCSLICLFFCRFCLLTTLYAKNRKKWTPRLWQIWRRSRIVRVCRRWATMAFSVATNNRFDLFVDDDEEADELLTKQQREVAVERQRRDSDKRSGKAKTSGRQVAGKGQTQPHTVKPASDDKTVKAATPSSGTTHHIITSVPSLFAPGPIRSPERIGQ